MTGSAVFVLDERVTADQIAVIASLADAGTETKMLSEVSLEQGGFIVFSNLDDASDTAVIKQEQGNVFVSGNVQDAIKVMLEQDYQSLLEKYEEITIKNGQIVEQQPEEIPVVEQEAVPNVEISVGVEEEIEVEPDVEVETEVEAEPELMEEPLTPALFMEQYVESGDKAVVVIGEKAPTGQLIGALHLAGKYGLDVVKDTSVQDITSLHAISLGPAFVNALSAEAIEQGAVASGLYYIYEDKEAGTAILVVAGDNAQETRRAVKSLLTK